jgi:serine phosphatase RsbU (regulator of sigma subunit)
VVGGPRPGGLPLARLLDARRVTDLLGALAAVAPGARIILRDEAGSAIAWAPSGASEVAGTRQEDGDRLAVRHLGTTVGTLETRGLPPAVGEAAVAALEAIVAEASSRRAVALEALASYRELNLLYRVAASLSASLDPAVVADDLLWETSRALRADVAAIVPSPDVQLSVADRGEPANVATALRAGGPAVERAIATGQPGPIDDPVAGGSVMVTPVPGRQSVLGAMVLGRSGDGAAFGPSDQRLAAALADQGGVAIERALMARRDAERARLDHELALGRQIQRSLLPLAPPTPVGWEIAAAYEAAQEVGGDFYDVFPLRGRRQTLGWLIADVTGKGIGAALLMAFTRPLLRAIVDRYRAPGLALEAANRVLVEERRPSLFITVFLAVVNTRTGELRYASAGHEPPYLVPGDGSRVRRLAGSGRMLGAFGDLRVVEKVVTVRPGDLVLAYTDGATDCQAPDGRRFGDRRLLDIVREAAPEGATAVIEQVMEAARRFGRGAPPADDLTLLALRRERRTRPGTGTTHGRGG